MEVNATQPIDCTSDYQSASLIGNTEVNSTATLSDEYVMRSEYHAWQIKTAPFYFCNSFVRTSSIMTASGRHILR